VLPALRLKKSKVKYGVLCGGAGLRCSMADWIARANIEHFKKLLEAETDSQKRAVIERELAEEEAKLSALIKNQGQKKHG
jgi:hypothetical protein